MKRWPIRTPQKRNRKNTQKTQNTEKMTNTYHTKMSATVQLHCYWKQLWSRWAITGSWESLVISSVCYQLHSVLLLFNFIIVIYVRLRSMPFPQIRVQTLCHTQIHVLPKPCPFKSVSSDVTPRSMSFRKHISSDLCPLTSYSDLWQNKFSYHLVKRQLVL